MYRTSTSFPNTNTSSDAQGLALAPAGINSLHLIEKPLAKFLHDEVAANKVLMELLEAPRKENFQIQPWRNGMRRKPWMKTKPADNRLETYP